MRERNSDAILSPADRAYTKSATMPPRSCSRSRRNPQRPITRPSRPQHNVDAQNSCHALLRGRIFAARIRHRCRHANTPPPPARPRQCIGGSRAAEMPRVFCARRGGGVVRAAVARAAHAERAAKLAAPRFLALREEGVRSAAADTRRSRPPRCHAIAFAEGERRRSLPPPARPAPPPVSGVLEQRAMIMRTEAAPDTRFIWTL